MDIFHAHQTYLGFCFDDNFYCFTILAFGLSSAPFILLSALEQWLNYGEKIPLR